METSAAAKRAARTAVRSARRATPEPERAAATQGFGRSAKRVTALLDERLPGLFPTQGAPARAGVGAVPSEPDPSGGTYPSGGAPPRPLTIAAYLAAAGEPDLDHALRRWHQKGHAVIVPICAPNHQLDWVLWHPDVQIGTSALAPVPEPVGAQPASAQEARLVLVPALSVAADGTRLGQGGGYYDRFLAEHAGLHVGVVFDHEVVRRVPSEPWDAVLDAVWTPSGVSSLPLLQR